MKRRSPLLILKALAMNYFVAVVGSAILALIVRFFVVEAFRIPTDFMSPTLLPGDHVFVNKLAYGSHWFASKPTPARGDVIVFSFPNDQKREYIKRVVGVAGDTIEIKEGQVFVNNKGITRAIRKISSSDQAPCPSCGIPLQPSENRNASIEVGRLVEEELGDKHYFVQWSGGEPEEMRKMIQVKVPQGHIFVLGDHRSKGQDSRTYGFLPVEAVKGKAFLIWFSIERNENTEGAENKIRWSRVFMRVG